MGYLLKEVLKTLCGVNRWAYAIFWKIGSQNPKLLIWEECFHEPILCSSLPSMPGMDSSELCFDGLESCWALVGQSKDKVGALINKMMLDKQVQIVGQGLVGQAAFTGNHLWVISQNYIKEIYPPEVQNEVCQQFSSCMKTVAVIPVLSHGVIQLGSSFSIMESMAFVNDVKSLILELAHVPCAPLLDNHNLQDSVLEGVPLFPGKPTLNSQSQALELVGQSTDSLHRLSKNDLLHTSSKFHCPEPANDVINGILQPSIFQPTKPTISYFSNQPEIEVKGSSDLWLDNEDYFFNQLSGINEQLSSVSHMNPIENGLNASTRVVPSRDLTNHLCSVHVLASTDLSHCVKDNEVSQVNVPNGRERLKNDFFQGIEIPLAYLDEPSNLNEHTFGNCDVSQKYSHGRWTSDFKNTIKDGFFQTSSGEDLFDILGGAFKDKVLNQNSDSFNGDVSDTIAKASEKNNQASILLQDADSSLYSVNGESDSVVYSSSGTDHLLDAVVSKFSNFSASSSHTLVNLSKKSQGELFGSPKFWGNLGVMEPISFKGEHSKKENFSEATCIYGSQISSLVDPSQSMKHNGGTSTAYSKRSDDVEKSNRKRVKPGDKPRPRPKDRQMIQDRMKELREIIPNGSKCSIDTLLERTIKHMLFLHTVMEHADKLRQTEMPKSISKESGLLLQENFEGGRTWAYEVGSQSMVCPIIVEDLNPARQMLVEMLCEEHGIFLEIADIVRGLGLTILKGVMETRNDKIWARFVVEANRDITRMEIFVSLVHLLEQTDDNVPSVNAVGTENPMAPQLFHQVPSITTSRPCSL